MELFFLLAVIALILIMWVSVKPAPDEEAADADDETADTEKTARYKQ